jgi:hypothetical protein
VEDDSDIEDRTPLIPPPISPISHFYDASASPLLLTSGACCCCCC